MSRDSALPADRPVVERPARGVAGVRVWVVAGCVLTAGLLALAWSSGSVVGQEDADDTIHIEADYSQEWNDGGTNVAVLRGNVIVEQGGTRVRARQAVLWREVSGNGSNRREYLSLYLEDDVELDREGSSQSGSSLYMELLTASGITHRLRRRLRDTVARDDPVFVRGTERRREARRERVVRTRMELPGVVPREEDEPEVIERPRGTRRVRIFPRSAVPFNVESFRSDATPPEQIWMLTGGVNVILDGDAQLGTIDLAADRIVIWTRTSRDGEFRTESLQSTDTPFQVYLEGNIVIRQGDRVVRASRAFYDAREDRGMMLDAELRAPLRTLAGTVRIRAEEIRQFAGQRFHARRGWASTSEYGKPGYRLQSSDIFLEKRYLRPWINGTDPDTGRPVVEEVNWLTADHNTILINDVPVFYNRRISAPAEDPNIPLSSIAAGNDRIFGARLETRWNMFQLTGIEEPPNARWDLYADWRSNRGIGLGTGGVYGGSGGLFGLPGSHRGEGLLYFMTENGTDNLGGFRQDVQVDEDVRGRVQLRHRQDITDGPTLFVEVGLLTDRNVLEQYWEQEFDNGKDVETLVYGEQLIDNWAVTGLVSGRPNEWDTTTSWLPRIDLYGLSEPLAGGRLTWSHHSYAGYANLEPGTAPSDPTSLLFYTPLTAGLAGPSSPNGLVANAGGAVLMTRHKVDAPLHLGPVNITPYVMGEAAYWGEGFAGSSVDRLVGTVGVNSSVLLWKVFPHVRSRLFNLNGLAHKMRFEAGWHLTDSSENLANIPQYNDIDDNAEERFREFFNLNTFGGTMPATLEPRFYALRSGAGFGVASPYHELVDDQHVVRLAWRHRLQTKVGPPDRLRIRDWMTLDLEGSYFPDAGRDNFGEDVGLLNARYQWFLSDRTRLVAGVQHDLFANAPSIRTVSLTSQRGQRGAIGLGYRQFEFGPVVSDIVTASYSYQMSPKWSSTLATTYDVRNNQDLGQSVTVTRLGRDFITHFGFAFTPTKDDVGFVFLVQPRIGGFGGGTDQIASLFAGGQQQQ